MYRIVKCRYSKEFAIHKIAKKVNGELYIEADPAIKAESLSKLKKLCQELATAFTLPTLDKSDVVILHRTVWNENEIPFYEDISDDVLEEEYLNDDIYSDDDKAHSRW